MSGAIDECRMLFAELSDDQRMREALAVLKTEIESFLTTRGPEPATVDHQRLANAYADVYWLLDAQR